MRMLTSYWQGLWQGIAPMSDRHIAIAPDVGCAGFYLVDLALDTDTLSERLFDVGIWLVEWRIPHQAKVSMQPTRHRIRISFPEERHAHAFHLQFGGELATEKEAAPVVEG